MAPRTRAVARRELVCAKHAPTGDNFRGFAALPIELLHNVVSCMQEPPIPHRGEWAVASVYRERMNVLLALCQFCRSLRMDLLPLLWERLEACATPARIGDDHSSTVLMRELIGQLRIVTGKESYASYVRVINVALEGECADAMECLANAMDLMPNLHTIQIICERFRIRKCCKGRRRPQVIDATQFLKAFGCHDYPSVRRAILPTQARDMLASLPAVVDVYINSPSSYHLPEFATALAANCPVESLGWQVSYSASTAVVQHFPNIRRVECHITVCYVDEIKCLSALRNLEKLTLTVADYLDSTDHKVTEVIEAARKALAASSRPNKCLEVIFMNGSRTVTFDF